MAVWRKPRTLVGPKRHRVTDRGVTFEPSGLTRVAQASGWGRKRHRAFVAGTYFSSPLWLTSRRPCLVQGTQRHHAIELGHKL